MQHAKQTKTRLLIRIAIFLTPILLIMLAVLTPENPMVGAVQRLAETIIYAWLILWLYQLAKAPQPVAN